MTDSPFLPVPAQPRRAIRTARDTGLYLFMLAALDPAIAAQARPAAPAKGTVRYVTDGDTFRLTSGERIRIAGIDAPETQPKQARCAAERRLGEAAKAWLTRRIEGRSLRFERVGRSYARTVATVSFEGQDLAAMLVASGHAAWWPRGRVKPDWCRSR